MELYKILFSKNELILFMAIAVAVLLVLAISVMSAFRRIKAERDEFDSEAEIYKNLWCEQLVREAEKKYSSFVKKGYQDRLPEISDVLGKEIELMHQIDDAESASQEKEVLKRYVPDIILSLVRYKYEGFEDFSPKEAKHIKRMMQKYGIAYREETTQQ